MGSGVEPCIEQQLPSAKNTMQPDFIDGMLIHQGGTVSI